MNEIEKLMEMVRESAKHDLEGLRERVGDMSFGTKRATPAQISAMVGNLLKRYPPQLWMNKATGEVVLDSSAMIALRENPNVINGKEIWREIERAVKGGGR